MKFCTVLSALALFLTFPGVVTLACLLVTVVVLMVDTITDDLDADAKN